MHSFNNYPAHHRLTAIATSLALILIAPHAVTAQTLANTSYGINALISNTANDNSAFGYGALQFNTTGFRNTATGQGALYSNMGGYQNTAVGSLALVLNTQGSENTATGVGALYSNTSGFGNTATGSHSLERSATGNYNTAAGFQALYSNSGDSNTATGSSSLYSNTSGSYNTASGQEALLANTSGDSNTAFGSRSIASITIGWGNTAIGFQSLYNNIAGHNNIAVGLNAGYALKGSNNIDIGNQGNSGDNNTIRIGDAQNRAFIAGISGKTASGGVQVFINSAGQLGTATSSQRFKQDIQSIDTVSDKLLQLRPVSFRYNEAAEDGDRPLQYGLIAEEVAKVYPELVQYDQEGKPFTVYYHLLTPLLLSELQNEHQKLAAQQTELANVNQQLAAQRAEMLAMLQQQKQQLAEMTVLQKKLSQLDDLLQASSASKLPSERVAMTPSH